MRFAGTRRGELEARLPPGTMQFMIKCRWAWVALAMFAGVFAYAIFINA